MQNKYLKELSFPESYISITLGFLVVVVGGILLYNFFTKNNPKGTVTNETTNSATSQEIAVLPTKHTVSENETLWVIAEKYYHSGYNWVTIAQANNLVNADLIENGQELTIPKAQSISPESGQEPSVNVETPKTYTVVAGDDLWNIAIKEYADGYKWTTIAQTNNLVNPNLIHPGNILTLPR